MLQIIILIVIGIAGARQESLSWKPFAILAVIPAVLLPVQIAMKTSALERMGESTAGYWEPGALAGNWAINLAMYVVAYMIGFGIGKWRRGRERR